MSEENNWIEEAKIHFASIKENDKYTDGDEKSKKSKEFNDTLKNKIKDCSKSAEGVSFNIRGNKWGKQGHKELSRYVWYSGHDTKYGEHYPIVINITLDKNGLRYKFDINEKVLNNKQGEMELLESIMEEATESSSILDFQDFTFDNINKIVEDFPEFTKNVNQKIYDKILELYKTSTTSSKHCQITKDTEHYTNIKNVTELVDKFLETPTEDKFKAFWTKEIINSAQQKGNATNILKNYDDNIDNLKDNVKKLTELSDDTDDSTNLIDSIKTQIIGSKNTSLELYYCYNMEKDTFPLINGGVESAIKMIEKNEIELIVKNENIVDKIISLKKEMGEQLKEKLYLVDQFLNLIDKIKYKDIREEEGNKELYQYAYLFTFWQKTNKTNNAEYFDDLLKKSQNIILYGAPGTGKTYSAEMNINRIIEEDFHNKDINEDRFLKVQFHPSYSYEDFMEGLKPVLDKNGNFSLELKEGDFTKFCKIASEYEKDYIESAEKDKMKYTFFFLVDEINRAELSRVFGEIMYALDKRGNKIRTQYSYLKSDENKEFSIPKNLYFIGTMNDVDKSIDSFDIALRRRFFWWRMDCDYNVIKEELSQFKNIGSFDDKKEKIPQGGYLQSCYNLNQYIIEQKNGLGLGKLYELGHSYFMNIRSYTEKSKSINKSNLSELFEFSISPLLKEYIRTKYDETEIEKKLEEAKKIFTSLQKENK